MKACSSFFRYQLALVRVLCTIIMMVWVEYMFLRRYNFHRWINQDCYEDPFAGWDDFGGSSNNSSTTNNIIPRKIVITGLVRNASSRIQKNMAMCQLLGSYFLDYKIVVFENDSVDGTRDRLKRMAREDPNIKLIDSEYFRDCRLKIPSLYGYGVVGRDRIRRMAFYRNICHSIIYRHYADYDFVMTLDFDIEGILPIPRILDRLRASSSSPQPWAAICANGRSPLPGTFGFAHAMYDAMAFCEHESDVESARYPGYDHHEGGRSGNMFLGVVWKYLRMLRLFSSLSENGEEHAVVESAFNGLCIYRLEDIKGLFYNDLFLCEHISLNHQLRRRSGKQICIDLKMPVFVGHQGPMRILEFW